MITIPGAVEKIIKGSPFLEEGISQGIINYSALARIIKDDVENETLKEVTEGAIIMALKRLSTKPSKKQMLKKFFKTHPDMIVRSNLMEYTLINSEYLVQKHKRMLDLIAQNKYFLVLTQGVFETTLIISRDLKDKVQKIFQGEKIVSRVDMLSAITIRLPEDAVSIPGIFYFVHKALAWEGINVVEVASTLTEFTIVIKEKDVDRAFSILKNLLGAH